MFITGFCCCCCCWLLLIDWVTDMTSLIDDALHVCRVLFLSGRYVYRCCTYRWIVVGWWYCWLLLFSAVSILSSSLIVRPWDLSCRRLSPISEEEKNGLFWACRAKRWRMFGEGNHSRNDSWVKRTWQTKNDLAQQHHVMDRTWNRTTASEYQQQEGVASARSQCDQPSEWGWLKKKSGLLERVDAVGADFSPVASKGRLTIPNRTSGFHRPWRVA